ncbi:MAG: hypothetical protein ACK5JU_01755, partial [Bacteroidales bacterium]
TCHFFYYLYSQTFFLFLSTTPNYKSHEEKNRAEPEDLIQPLIGGWSHKNERFAMLLSVLFGYCSLDDSF